MSLLLPALLSTCSLFPVLQSTPGGGDPRRTPGLALGAGSRGDWADALQGEDYGDSGNEGRELRDSGKEGWELRDSGKEG